MVRSDNGTEYTSDWFEKFCEDSGIENQLTVSYTQQKNGVSERKNWSIMDMSRCLLYDKGVPEKLWQKIANKTSFCWTCCQQKAWRKRHLLRHGTGIRHP